MTEPGAIVHVVDDDDLVRTRIVRVLRAAGYEVRDYNSAGAFLLADPHRNGPGCIVLDVQMPGPSGLELQTALARLEAALPIVFLSGHGDIQTSVRAMKAGAVDFLTKPVETRSAGRRGARRACARCRDAAGTHAGARVPGALRDANAARTRSLRRDRRRQAQQANRRRARRRRAHGQSAPSAGDGENAGRVGRGARSGCPAAGRKPSRLVAPPSLTRTLAGSSAALRTAARAPISRKREAPKANRAPAPRADFPRPRPEHSPRAA